MQLFTIGLYELNRDGSLKRDAQGQPIETYRAADVSGLAKVFTGLSWDSEDGSDASFAAVRGSKAASMKRMRMYNQFHSASEKKFLGVTIAATPASQSVNGDSEIKLALDRLFNHSNTAPFVSRQLIQRFVSASPSPEYIERVARAFENNGRGVRGDLAAVMRAVLLDREARDASLISPTSGKLREPVVRHAGLSRAMGTEQSSAKTSGSSLATGSFARREGGLNQSPIRSPSVFNFFRPGYVPSNSVAGSLNMTSPEMQILTEVSIASTANYAADLMRLALDPSPRPAGTPPLPSSADLTIDLASAGDAGALVERLNLRIAAGNLSSASKDKIIEIVNLLPATTDRNLKSRIAMAAYLIAIHPESVWLQ
jgi:uncharacterized protein (DUF1800 family)